MIKRVSSLAGHFKAGKYGILATDKTAGVILQDIADLHLHQLAAWPETAQAVGNAQAKLLGLSKAPGPNQVATKADVAMLRIEPLKWWVFGSNNLSKLDANQGATLDISHSRTLVRITGVNATDLLKRHLPLDLRPASFAVNSVASSTIHHVGVTLWHSKDGFELFIPRGFALSIIEGMIASAKQFGLEII